MSLETKLRSLALRSATEAKALRTLINGNLTDLATLSTTTKVSLLAAVNEVHTIAVAAGESGGATALDQLTDVTVVSAAPGDILIRGASVFANEPGTDHFDAAGAAAAAQAAAIAASDPAGSAAAAQAASQPVDADLTSISSQDNTVYGLALLELADQAALMLLLAAASETSAGIVELSTVAEAQTGTDATKAVTPAGAAALITQLIGAAPADLNSWAELVAAIEASEDDIAGLLTAIAGKQDSNARLSAIAGATVGADQILYFTGSNTVAATGLSAAARALLDDADAAAMRTTLDVYSKTEIGDPEADLVAEFEAGLV